MEPDRKRLKLESDDEVRNVETDSVEVDTITGKSTISEQLEPDRAKLEDNDSDINQSANTDTAETLIASSKDNEKTEEQKLTLDSNDAVKRTVTDLHTKNVTEQPVVAEHDKEVRTQPVQEKDVGITEYISNHNGFQGIIKQRYSDFLVSEIDLSGEVVKLTSFGLPTEEVLVKADQDVSGILSDSNMEKIEELIKSGSKTDAVLIEVDDDKDKRARIHKAVASGFTGLDSTTVNKDDKKYIEVKIATNKVHNFQSWPKERGDYCRFVLYKENKDTMDTVSILAKTLRLKSSLFQYAGTKDRRAKTSQEVTAYRISAEKLLDVNKKLRNIATGNYRYVKKPLGLGDSKGNKFTMILRSVTGSEEEVKAAMTSLQEVGFINYYGMQRFGTSSVPTHHIGRAVLHSNWKEAIELILKPRFGEDKEVCDARTFWWETRDSQAALAKFPKHCFIERTILQGLVTHGKNDYLAALKKVARNTQLMYVHSYQSYVWNTMVSRRIRELGLKPVVGDLVIPSDESVSCSGDSAREKVVPAIVTDDTLANYSIEDVVLPLPGYNVIYPENDTKSWYQELMAQDCLDVDNMRHKTKEYSLSGDYRHIVIKPADVSWQIYQYDDVTIPLALSDYDKLQGVSEPQTVEDGKHVALRLELTLPSSCYATMAIREVLKMDTSSAYQSSLNVT